MNKKRKPILYFDIETSILAVWTHAIGQQYVSYLNLMEGYNVKYILCISYKEPQWKKAKSLKWDHKKKCDKKLLRDFTKICKGYDLLLAHNGQGFDIKEIRTAIAMRGLEVPWCETHCLDTLKDWRHSFRMTSNRLDAVARQLGVGRKSPINIEHWIKSTQGDKKALDEMDKYCKVDTEIMQKCHERLKKYVKPTQENLNRLTMTYTAWPNHCTKCSNKNPNHFIKYGFYSYKQEPKQKFLCKQCGKVLRPDKDKDDG